ncbi:MAG: hypothetical protein K6T85_12100, partial [Gorillibacterium sp.]|nr:hypothetical protein [Gorillibacterium sp.]
AMDSRDIIIGEHILRISFASVAVKSLFFQTFPSVFTSSGGEPSIHIHLDEGYGSPFTDYDIVKQISIGVIQYQRTDYIIETIEDYRFVTMKVHDALALKHALMHLYSLYIVHNRWGLLIHSSCVIDNGSAYMFTGHSGAGKSTAAVLSLSRGIIADEATVIRIRSDGVSVFHSPFRSELQNLATDESRAWPLNGIHLLHQAKHHWRTPLTKSEGLMCMMDKVFYWNPSTDETMAIIHLLKQTVELVPLYDLYFQKNPDFWELIS